MEKNSTVTGRQNYLLDLWEKTHKYVFSLGGQVTFTI